MMQKAYVTQKSVAEAMGKSVRTVHRYIKEKKLIANDKGKVLFSSLPPEIQEILSQRKPMMKYKPSDINQYQARIKFVRSSDELHELIAEIIEHFGCFPHALLPAYKNRLGGHIGPVSGTLHRVIADTDSKELYTKYKSRISEFDQLNMMTSGFYHEELEEKFCQHVYQWVKTKAYQTVTSPAWIVDKLDALAASGQSLSLDTLEILWQEISRVSQEVKSEQDINEHLDLWRLRKKIPEWKKMISKRLRVAA